MLDIYQVVNTVRAAQFEFKNKFEEDYPDLVELLTNEIIFAAKNGDTETKINFWKYLNKSKYNFFEMSVETRNLYFNKVEKYLNIKGFYTKTHSGVHSDTYYGILGADIPNENNCNLFVSWPKN